MKIRTLLIFIPAVLFPMAEYSQPFETRSAHDPQHFGDLLGRRPDVVTIREVAGFVCVGAHLVPMGHHIISH